jgi:crotonobetainyl-CoA:carnitine CoA-transferase CaiB-like acyl-CoA transferase
MQEFTRVRAAIDSLIDEIKESIKRKSRSESMEQLEQARGLIQELKQMSTTDQAAIVAKRETTIASLTDIAGKLKKPAIKKRSTKEALVQAATL